MKIYDTSISERECVKLYVQVRHLSICANQSQLLEVEMSSVVGMLMVDQCH